MVWPLAASSHKSESSDASLARDRTEPCEGTPSLADPLPRRDRASSGAIIAVQAGEQAPAQARARRPALHDDCRPRNHPAPLGKAGRIIEGGVLRPLARQHPLQASPVAQVLARPMQL